MNTDWLTLGAGTVAVAGIWATMQMRKQISGYQLKIRQLKDQIHTQEGLQSSGKQIDELLAEINEAIFRLDKDSRVKSANPCAREYFSIGNTHLPAPLQQFYRDSDWIDQFKQARSRLPEQTLLPTMLTSGHVLAPRIAQLKNGDVLLICMDITEQHRLEQQRRTFLSNLMHDLKTPLTSLLGYARSMEDFGDDADFRKEAAMVIADESKHVNQLLDALLTLDQAEYAAKDEDARCDVTEVIHHICEMLTPQSEEKQIGIECIEEQDHPVMVAITEESVDRVITNLLANAIVYAPENSTIRISIEVDEKQCAVYIDDEGDGIPEKEIPRVTERFYRVNKARSRDIAGHGLGLAIVKELIEANNGTLILSNRKPNGLRAGFTIPLAD